jgi:hypothetical protein
MSGTPAPPLITKPSPFATALLLRLLRPGSAQTTVTPPEKAPPFSFWINPGALITASDMVFGGALSGGATATARHAPASRYYGETRGTTSAHLNTRTASTSPTCIAIQSPARGFEGWRAHLSSDPPIDRFFQHEFLNDESGREPRVLGWREVLNDVAGREPRVFRKSPCPPRGRNASPPPPSSAAGGGGDNSPCPPRARNSSDECLNDVSGREPRVFRKSPCPPRARNASPSSPSSAARGGGDKAPCPPRARNASPSSSSSSARGRNSSHDSADDASG